jgi:predicted ester cyclase
MSTEQNKAIVRRWMTEVVDGGNIALIDELVAPNYTNTAGLDRAQVKELVAAVKAGIPDLRTEIVNLVAEGDVVVSRFIMTGTHTGSIMGEPPTGKKFSSRGLAYFRLTGGRIVEDEPHATPNMMQALGIQMPAQPARQAHPA